MDTFLLNDIIIVLGLSIVVLLICDRLSIPAVVGFLLTGALVGPQGLALITGIREVNLLAKIGINR